MNFIYKFINSLASMVFFVLCAMPEITEMSCDGGFLLQRKHIISERASGLRRLRQKVIT